MKVLKIKKTRLTCDEWPILEKDYQQKYLQTENFTGIASTITIKKVEQVQIWRHEGQDLTVCDKGMHWFHFIPDNQHYAILMMLDAKLEPVVWYVDFIEDTGTDSDGIYYFHDLFLDLIIYPDRQMKVEDLDELDSALAQGIITKKQWEQTQTANEALQETIAQDFAGFKAWCVQIIADFSDNANH